MDLKKKLFTWVGVNIQRFLNYSNVKPYQSFLYNGKYIEGKVDTVRLYYNLGISKEVKGKSVLDLGCNEGSICLLAAQDGATRVDGVEIEKHVCELAQKRAKEAGLDINYLHNDIVDYIENTSKYDIIFLFAMMRHIHKKLMIENGHDISSSGRAYLVYNSYQTLILGEDSPVKIQFDNFMKKCISKSNSHFICSINDHSGLIVRRQEKAKKYFYSLSNNIKSIEIYNFSPQNPEYTVIDLRLNAQ